MNHTTRTGLSLFLLLALTSLGWWIWHMSQPAQGESLPRIGVAPPFSLVTQDGAALTLADLRGKVVVVTFIYTSCVDTCPVLTAKMALLQNSLGADFGRRVHFVSISVDPERDTPEVLTQYAATYQANLAGWSFLTGKPGDVWPLVRRYGLYLQPIAVGDVDHSFLTSIVDQRGALRVQYLGTRFDPDEMRRDIQSLLREGRRG